MSQNEKIRTEDVVELKDIKVFTSSPHASIGVIAGEAYDGVLSKIELQTLSSAEKAALGATASTPSALNPVVLRADLEAYIGAADLGNVKDNVPTTADLPPFPANTSGDLRAVDLEGYIARWFTTTLPIPSTQVSPSLNTFTSSGAHGLSDGLGVTIENADPFAYPDPLTPETAYYLVGVTPTTFQLSLTLSGSPIDLLTSGSGTHAIVTAGSWSPFIRTGTLLHTGLTTASMNSDPLFQHLTLGEKTSLLGNEHTHSNKTSVLDLLIDAGSGSIITTAERSRIPTADQKAALPGTSGTPSAANPYVTNNDPRLNTVRNPYVTVGPPGSNASFQGVDFRPFEDALLAIDTGSAQGVKAIEVLPGFYTLGGVFLDWNNNSRPLLLEAFAPYSVTLSFSTRTNPSIQIRDTSAPPPSSKGPLTLRGFVIELNDLGTVGLLAQRPYTLIEDCVFRAGPTYGANQVGAILEANRCVLRRCRFEGALGTGVIVRGDECRVEGCTFNLTNPTFPAIDLDGAFRTIITNNTFTSGVLSIDIPSEETGVYANSFAFSTVDDLGVSTRILQNLPPEENQPYCARVRTIGEEGSWADFRGLTQTTLEEALADPLTQELRFLGPNSWPLVSTVSVPDGVLLRGDPGSGISGGMLSFGEGSGAESLEISQTTLYLLPHTSLRMNTIQSSVIGTSGGAHDVTLEGNEFQGCLLTLAGTQRAQVLRNRFLLSPFQTLASNAQDLISGNWFFETPSSLLDIRGSKMSVTENIFAEPVPTKTGTSESVWSGNWPHPEANNIEGVDTLRVPVSGLEPLGGSGCTRAVLTSGSTSLGTLSFADVLTSSAGTTPIPLAARLNRTLGFTLTLNWGAAGAGACEWRVGVCFLDQVGGTIGTSSQKSLTPSRASADPLTETSTTFTFTPLDYGLGAGVNPTHVTLVLERLGGSLLDTIPSSVYLFDVAFEFARD